MDKQSIKELSLAGFKEFGSFANMINPQSLGFGEQPIEFFRDMLQLQLGTTSTASFSICRVSKRPLVIERTEIHSSCGEGIMPLDGDAIIHVGPAWRNGIVPLEQIEVFRVPKGTMVALRPGVWHHAPFALNNNVVNVMIVLPERTYANDCHVEVIPEDHQILIEEG